MKRERPARGRHISKSAASPAGTPVWVDLAIAVGLAIWAIVTMWPAAGGAFLAWDDQQTVASNPWLRDDATRFSHFWAHPYMDLYVPVTYQVWATITAANEPEAGGPLDPRPFHIANILLHATATVLAYTVLRRLFGPLGAVAGAVVFAVHPVQVEAVAWTSGLKDVLGGLLFLAALWADPLAADEAPERAKESPKLSIRYGIATLLFVAAVLAKPGTMVLPLVVLAFAWARGRTLWSRAVAVRMVPWLVIAAACAVWTAAIQPVHQQYEAPLWLRPIVAGHALATYLWKLVVPAHLAIDYGYSPRWLAAHPAAWAAAIVPLVLAVMLFSFRRRWRIVTAAALIFVLGLAPVLGLVRFDFQFYSTVADHYLYVPMLGVAIAIGAGAEWLRRRDVRASVPVSIGVAVVAAALATRSWFQARHWRDTRTLFEHTLTVNPESLRALDTLATLALERRDPGAADAYIQRALRVKPDDPTSLVGAASLLWMKGDREGALQRYAAAVEAAPHSGEVLVNYAVALAQSGKMDEAARHLLHAIEVDPNDAKAHLNLGTLYIQQDKLVDARREFELAARLNPTDPQAHTNLGFALAGLGLRDRAIEEFRTALRIEPRFTPAAQGLAQLGANR